MRIAALGAALLVAAMSCIAAEPDAPRSILLVAGEKLSDPNFEKSLVLVTHSGMPGPVGVILNRPTSVPLADVIPEAKKLAGTDAKLYFGGPVARTSLLFLYRAPAAPADAIEVLDGVYLSWNSELLRKLLDRENPMEGLRVYAGHAGWAPGQLENEVSRGDWHLVRAESAAVFSSRPETLWPEFLRRASAVPIKAKGEDTEEHREF